MAQIDIGKLTFTHKGDYAGGTAYVANDVVYYNGSAYIAKTSTTGNLPTSTAHWNNFAAGSGGIWNAGLGIGSAGQVVKVLNDGFQQQGSYSTKFNGQGLPSGIYFYQLKTDYGVLTKKKLYTKTDMKDVKYTEKETKNEVSQPSVITSFLQSVRQKMYGKRKF